MPASLRDIAEPGGDDGGVQNVSRNHLAGLVIPDRLHNENLPAAVVADGEGIPLRPPEVHLGKGILSGQDELWGESALTDVCRLPGGPAGDDNDDGDKGGQRRNGYTAATVHRSDCQ